MNLRGNTLSVSLDESIADPLFRLVDAAGKAMQSVALVRDPESPAHYLGTVDFPAMSFRIQVEWRGPGGEPAWRTDPRLNGASTAYFWLPVNPGADTPTGDAPEPAQMPPVAYRSVLKTLAAEHLTLEPPMNRLRAPIFLFEGPTKSRTKTKKEQYFTFSLAFPRASLAASKNADIVAERIGTPVR